MFVEHNYECVGCHANTVEKPDDICDECFGEITKQLDLYAAWEQEQIEVQQEND